jgi:hypothetical protein
MEQILCEPVELTEFELDAVAGGLFGSFTGNNTNSGSFAGILDANGPGSEVSIVELVNILDNHPTTSIVNVVNNSINIGGS